LRFSLVLATVGRVSEVERFLSSLGSQTHREFEVIVVDQNEDERLLPVLTAYQERFPILHLREVEPGLSRARNVGLPHLVGDVVAFPDDDCWYPPELLERVARTLCNHPQLDGLTGRMIDERGRSGTARFDKRPGLLAQANVWQRATSISLFLRRGVVEAVGDFDETLGIGAGTLWGGGEDIDYTLRAVEGGFKVYYRPDVLVFHPSPPAPDYSKLADRAYRYGAGIGRVWRKHDYPLWLVAYYLLRPAGGTILSLMSGRKSKAYYHFNGFQGRLRGWLSG
jgi:glycosyltransferase involved in cell wall biosynthesis